MINEHDIKDLKPIKLSKKTIADIFDNMPEEHRKAKVKNSKGAQYLDLKAFLYHFGNAVSLHVAIKTQGKQK